MILETFWNVNTGRCTTEFLKLMRPKKWGKRWGKNWYSLFKPPSSTRSFSPTTYTPESWRHSRHEAEVTHQNSQSFKNFILSFLGSQTSQEACTVEEGKTTTEVLWPIMPSAPCSLSNVIFIWVISNGMLIILSMNDKFSTLW